MVTTTLSYVNVATMRIVTTRKFYTKYLAEPFSHNIFSQHITKKWNPWPTCSWWDQKYWWWYYWTVNIRETNTRPNSISRIKFKTGPRNDIAVSANVKQRVEKWNYWWCNTRTPTIWGFYGWSPTYATKMKNITVLEDTLRETKQHEEKKACMVSLRRKHIVFWKSLLVFYFCLALS